VTAVLLENHASLPQPEASEAPPPEENDDED